MDEQLEIVKNAAQNADYDSTGEYFGELLTDENRPTDGMFEDLCFIYTELAKSKDDRMLIDEVLSVITGKSLPAIAKAVLEQTKSV